MGSFAVVQCPLTDTFDVSASAVLYSTLAGVLAGFALVALIFILTSMGTAAHQARRELEVVSFENHLVVSLICTFLALVVSAVLYAILAAERKEALLQGRAPSEELLSGISFAFAVMALLYSLTLLIESTGLTATAHEVRSIVAIFTAPVTTMFIGFSGQDLAFAKLASSPTCRDNGFYRAMSIWGSCLLPCIALGVCLILVVLSRTKIDATSHHISKGKSWWSRNALPKISLVVALTAAVWSAFWSEKNPASGLTQCYAWAWLSAATLFLLAQTVFVLWAHPGDSVADVGEPSPWQP
jgi:hypothetical protein